MKGLIIKDILNLKNPLSVEQNCFSGIRKGSRPEASPGPRGASYLMPAPA